jgi:hypothetical protein
VLHDCNDNKFSRRYRAAPVTALASLLLLAACDDIKAPEPGYLGARLDRGPAPVTVTETGGYHGNLLTAGVEPLIPPTRADQAVGAQLAHSMKPAERVVLAEVSQQAAVAERLTKLDWQATSSSGEVSASGWAMPVSDPYLSSHGLVCRDLRQALSQPDGLKVEAVSLCREELAGGLAVWTLEHFP